MLRFIRFISLAAIAIAACYHAATAQVNAEFSAPVTSGCSPLIVNFQNQSTGSGLSYQWNLGNGNNSTAINPSATYIAPGTYTITLTATGPGGTDTETKTAFVTVFAPPTPDISASQQSGCFPMDVAFTDLSVPGDAPITNWVWDFGDGGASIGQSPSHTYTTSGVFTVTLLLTDANGCTSNQAFPGFISTTGSAPNVAFSGGPVVTCLPPVSVSFSNTSSGGTGALSYLWNFGDGGTSTQQNPSHIYATNGSFNVSLTVSDQAGCAATLSQPNYVTVAANPQVDFAADDASACLGTPVQFTDLSSPVPSSWLWNFGDGNTSNQQNPSHLYTVPGTYNVTLTASYGGSCQDVEVKNGYITVSGSPFTAFNVTNGVSCTVPHTVNFTNTSVGAGLTYLWDFGDGETSTATSPSHLYTTAGVYTVSLTATNPAGCSTTSTQNNIVNLLQTEADFVPDVFGFCTPVAVNFTNLSVSSAPITSYQWDFGDGNTSTAQSPSHTYNSTGMFTVRLIIENGLGCRDTLTRPNYIFSFPPPTANFVNNPSVICPGDFAFTNLSTGATDYLWDFGDNSTSTDEHPIHTYSDTGSFSITLIALNNGCADTAFVADMVVVIPPIARFNQSLVNCSSPNVFTFTNTSIGADSFSWDFGLGGPPNTIDNTVTMTYPPGPGMYFVELTVFNNITGCTHTRRDTVHVVNLNSDFTANITSACAPQLISFTNQSTDAVSYSWNFGGGASNATTTNPNRTFNNPGSYTVRLIATDINGCTDTTIRPNYINIFGANAAFSLENVSGCDELHALFNDQSTATGGIASWDWAFGDGGTSNSQFPTHTYTTGGTFDVTLSIVSVNGCTDTETLQITVVQDIPSPSFNANPLGGCPGQVIEFSGFSADFVSYSWDFGDGATSAESDPEHVYTQAGTFSVSLTVTSASGCSGTFSSADMITISQPTADFSASPTFAFCPPLLVSFTNLSTGAATYEWSFGNGNGSAIANPAHIYNQSGLYSVTLIAHDAAGCSDTIVMPDLVELSGPVGDFAFFPDTIGCPPYEVTYVSNATNATSYVWDFGDGFLGNGPIATHLYENIGGFIPSLILQDDNGCTFTYQSVDTLQVAPLAVSAGPDFTICEHESVQLQASGGTVFSWFPPNTLSDPASDAPMAFPTQTTDYVVTVQLGACLNTDTVTVFVNPAPVAAFFNVNSCFGTESSFLNLSTMAAPDSIISWEWAIGPDASQDTSPSIIISAFGDWDVLLTVTSSNGCIDTATGSITVFPAPTALFFGNDTCLLNPTFFTDLSNVAGAEIESWQWFFGNGATSTLQHPTLTYAEDSTWTVALVVTAEGGCTDTIVRSVSVHPLPQPAVAAQDVCLGQTVQFENLSTINSGSITSYQWQFGDSGSSTQESPEHLYQTAQAFIYSLVATSNHGCVSATSGSVSVRPLPISSFNMSAPSACGAPAAVSVAAQTQPGASYAWDFGPGGTGTGANSSAMFTELGAYAINLTATSAFGCEALSTQVFQVFPAVTANFTSSATMGCEPWTVDFENTSVNASVFRWEFGDATSSPNASPSHIYGEEGNYGVTLIATGEGGCADTLVIAGLITVWPNPSADFTFVNVVGDSVSDGTLLFTNTSSPYVTNVWDFGDGNTSTETPQVTYNYDASGSQLVTLVIVDENGCRDTLMRYVSVDFFGQLFVPNALVPSHVGSEANLFLPKGRGLSMYRCVIYDKWGNRMWESTALLNGEPAEGWNGTYRGEPVPQGAYVWHIEALFDNGTEWQGRDYQGHLKQTGSVTVLR